MTAMPLHAPRTDVDTLHVARSRVIDAFGEAERHIVALLRGADAKTLTAPLSQKITAVRKIEPSPRYSKKKRGEVHEALDRLFPLLGRRAEIAHSAMEVVRVLGQAENRACFRNPANQPDRGENAMLYRAQDLEALADDVRAIAKALAA